LNVAGDIFFQVCIAIFPVSCYLLSCRSKHLPQYPVPI
jgi:hypothetical protein